MRRIVAVTAADAAAAIAEGDALAADVEKAAALPDAELEQVRGETVCVCMLLDVSCGLLLGSATAGGVEWCCGLLSPPHTHTLTRSPFPPFPAAPSPRQALIPLKRAVDEAVIPAVAKTSIRERIAALTRRCLDAQKVCGFVSGGFVLGGFVSVAFVLGGFVLDGDVGFDKLASLVLIGPMASRQQCIFS